LLQATRTVPIVFAAVADPVGAGYVESLARPGGNATGFIALEWSVSGKWLELLKEIAPRVTRAAVLRDSTIAAGSGFFGAVQAPASTLGIELRPVDVRDSGEIERSVADSDQRRSGLSAGWLTALLRDDRRGCTSAGDARVPLSAGIGATVQPVSRWQGGRCPLWVLAVSKLQHSPQT
jgi:ABC transporter substrate binding protein